MKKKNLLLRNYSSFFFLIDVVSNLLPLILSIFDITLSNAFIKSALLITHRYGHWLHLMVPTSFTCVPRGNSYISQTNSILISSLNFSSVIQPWFILQLGSDVSSIRLLMKPVSSIKYKIILIKTQAMYFH